MTTIASDTFTDTNGTTLQSHTPSGGGTWTKSIGGAGVDIEIQSNQATPSGNNAWYYHSQDPTGVEYDCQFTIKQTGSTNYAIGLVGRCSTSAETGYLYHPGGSFHYLYKVSGGSYTELGTYFASVAINDVIKLEIKDATKRVFVNGTQRISSTNNDVTAKGKAGLRGYGTSTTQYVDDWQVVEEVTTAVKDMIGNGFIPFAR